MSGGDFYRETILDHYRNPRNKGRLSNQDVSIHDSNPGDEIEIHLKVEARMIKDIKFEGRGCAISQASASMLTDMVINKPLIFVMNLFKGDIFENMGLTNLGPARVKCALLSLKVLKMGMIRYYAEFSILLSIVWTELAYLSASIGLIFTTYLIYAPAQNDLSPLPVIITTFTLSSAERISIAEDKLCDYINSVQYFGSINCNYSDVIRPSFNLYIIQRRHMKK